MADSRSTKKFKRKHKETGDKDHTTAEKKAKREPEISVTSRAPRGINVLQFAESRALEIENMVSALDNASNNASKRVFQSVPRHMRRRAASHNAKRLPVRLREAHNRESAKSEIKKKDVKGKRKCRKYRRKPSSLLDEYKRRQQEYVWLETHIWHAKRFKMLKQWGYSIASHPNDKSIRASYRAMANDCLIQDISYYQCVEIVGEQTQIIAAMKHLSNPETGLTMAAKQYLNGSKEGHLVLYQCDQYPYHAIGPVSFLWQQTVTTPAACKLWVWSHPACRQQVSLEINKACSLEGKTDFKSDIIKVDKMSEDDQQLTVFTVKVLTEQLVRFRLIGPKSHNLLSSTFELFDWPVHGGTEGQYWWQGYQRDPELQRVLVEQNKLWSTLGNMTASCGIASGSVIGLVVEDPRLSLPCHKTSVDIACSHLTQGEDVVPVPPSTSSFHQGLAVSPLWDGEVREEVKKGKKTEKELNDLTSKMMVPGSKLDLGHETSRIPLLVIQQPGVRDKNNGCSENFGAGYDVIIPAGWSMAFWIAFVYRGARVGGAREAASCSREQGHVHFPCDFPDTKSGVEYHKTEHTTLSEKYLRYPPAKRPNYVKLGIACPFGDGWSRLVEEWVTETGVLQAKFGEVGVHGNNVDNKDDDGQQRDKGGSATSDNDGSLSGTSHIVVPASSSSGVGENNVSTNQPFFVVRSQRLRCCFKSIFQILKNTNKAQHSVFLEHATLLQSSLDHDCMRALVSVDLLMLHKGCPLVNAIVALPNQQDMKELRARKQYGGPTERMHDGNDSQSSLVHNCSRVVIGFVTSGQYSFARGQGSAIGFCTFPGLCQLLLTSWSEKYGPLVLIRNPSTYQYRLANLNVV